MDETLGGWLDALASSNPTPGGGSAAGLLIATGAALVEMACGLTIGREKYRDVEDLMQTTRARATSLRVTAEALRVADTQAYDEVSAAYGLPRGTPEEKEARSASIQMALRTATDVPLRTAETGVAVLELAAAIATSANPNVISDVGAGALAARAGTEAAALNVRINVVSLKDQDYVGAQRTAINDLLGRAESAANSVIAAVAAAIGD